MSIRLLAAAVQMNSTEDVERNLQTADRLTREAAAKGAELILLPEKWSVLGRGEAMREHAQTLDGPALSWAAQTAAELGVDLIAGSVVFRRETNTNTSIHFGPDGQAKASYDKLHMFDVEVDGVVYSESTHERAGDRLAVTELKDGQRLGMTICYDLRFPELYRELSRQAVTVITVPAAFTLATTRDHWEPLLRARAIENQAFVIAADQIGEHPPGNRCGGRSMIVDPWGTVLTTAADTECTIVVELDFEHLQRVRAKLPALSHRRPASFYAQGDTAL